MSWTKKQFVEQAFTELGLASYVFDLQPEQMQTALVRLDALVANWNAKGFRIGWPISAGPDNGDLDQVTECPSFAQEAIYLNLAVRLAPGFGKVVSDDLKRNAHDAYNTLANRFAFPEQLQYPGTLPRGAGNKPLTMSSTLNFATPPVDPLIAGPDAPLDLEE